VRIRETRSGRVVVRGSRSRRVASCLASAALAGAGILWTATQASASTTIDVRGSWALVSSTDGATYPQTVIWTTEDLSSGAVTGTDGPATMTGTMNGSSLKTHGVQPGYTWDSVGTVTKNGSNWTWSGTFTDSVGHPNGTFTATLTTPATGGTATSASSGLGPVPQPCTATSAAGTCTYNSRDGTLTFDPTVIEVGGTITAKMVSPTGVGNSWSWTGLPGLTPENCAPSAVTCTYLATAVTGSPGAEYVLGAIPGGSVQGAWSSAQAYAVIASTSGGKVLDVRGLWDGYYVAPGGAKYHNPVDFLTEDLASGALTGTDNGTDGPATISGSISGRTITATIAQPATNYSAQVTWVLSADGTKLIAGGITDPNATSAFVLFRHGAPVGGSAVTSGAGVTSGPAPITALPTPAEAFSSPGRIVASAAISIAALLFITFPANLFNKTFEENYDVIAAWWEPRLRRFRRKPLKTRSDAEGSASAAGTEPAAETGAGSATATEAVAETNRDRWTFGIVVVAGAILGGLLNPKFGANSASVNSFIATLLAVIVGTVVGTLVGFAYRRRKKYDVARHFEALPAGLAIAALCVILSRVSDFQPGYLYGVVCGVAFAGTLKKNENGHLVALGHLATIAVAVIAWFVWVPVNHAAQHHTGLFPLVILDDLLASLFVGGLVGSVINLIPVRFMPGHTLASWHRGAWMAVFGVAAFGMTLIVVFPSRHNHAGHAPLVTILVLFVLFGGGSLAFREYFSRRDKRLELAKAGAPGSVSIPEAGAMAADLGVPATGSDTATAATNDAQIPSPRADDLDPIAPLEPIVENASALGIETPRAETSGL
jgi:hypothetical protein